MTKKLCAHGKETWERCQPCEVDILAGKSTGFTPAQPPSNALVALLRAIQLDTCDRAADEIERMERELANRPALLDGLSIQQWKEHAKAGWKMYAARAENEPRKDHCEVCANPLPPVSAWSMPSCPDCQDLLEGLGQLMADFVDREQTIKADWIGRAINLLCARASQPPRGACERLCKAMDFYVANHTGLAELIEAVNDVCGPSLTKEGGRE